MSKRSQHNKIETEVKKWLKQHSPEYIESRRKYSSKDSVKERRSVLNKRRRVTATSCINLLKSREIKDNDGFLYIIKHGRLLRVGPEDTKVCKINKAGELFLFDFENDIDLLDEKLDEPLANENDLKLKTALGKLFKGDQQLEEAVRKKKVVIPSKLSEEECYWKSLTDEEQQELLDKIKC